MLELGTTSRAQQSHPRHDQLNWSLEDGQVAHTPRLQVVNRRDPLPAAAATTQHSRHWLKSDHAPGSASSTHFLVGLDLVPFPGSKARNTLGCGHGCPPQSRGLDNTNLAVVAHGCTYVRPRNSAMNLFSWAAVRSTPDGTRSSSALAHLRAMALRRRHGGGHGLRVAGRHDLLRIPARRIGRVA